MAVLSVKRMSSFEGLEETLNKSTDPKAIALQTNDDAKHISSRWI